MSNPNVRILSVEGLENRRLLAGDVHAELVDGNLRVAGDAQGNEFAIHRGPDPGQVVVAGRAGTTINGGPSVTFSDVTGRVLVRAGAGDDSILVRDLTAPDGLRIESGPGDDRVALQEVSARRLSVDSGLGDDVVRLNKVRAGEAVLLTGVGNDRVEIHASRFRERLSLGTGAGDDHVVMAEVTSDTMSLMTGDGEDRVNVRGSRIADASFVHLGDGHDRLVVQDSVWHGPARWLGGGGRDSLTLGADNVFHRRLFASFERLGTQEPDVPDAMATDIASALV